jgi:LEA14-like dessication related protein
MAFHVSMLRRVVPMFAVASVLGTAVACSAIGRAAFSAPVVSLKELTVTGIGLTGGSVDVVLSIYNPNHFKLDALSMTYRVDIDSTQLGTGALDKRFVVEAGDSSVVRLPVKFSYAGLGAAGRTLLADGTVNYRVRGDFTVGTPLGNFTRPYDRTGHYSSVTGTKR